MPSGPAQRYDFFLSRRGSVAAVAIEVADVLMENGYKVNVEDYDFRSRCELHRGHARRRSRTRATSSSFTPTDYEASLYTRKEFTSFVAEMAQSAEERHIIILRCEDVPCADCCPTYPFRTSWASQSRKNASGASSLLLSANRRQRHRHHDRSSGCRRVSRASQAARTNLIGSTPS